MSRAPPDRPPGLLLHPIRQDETFEAYRAVKVPDPLDVALEESFRSHYEAALPPQPLESQHAAIYMAVSLWKREDKIVRLARRFSKLGRYVARLELRYGYGLDYLDPSHERDLDHLTIWGTRESIAELVVDIVPIDAY